MPYFLRSSTIGTAAPTAPISAAPSLGHRFVRTVSIQASANGPVQGLLSAASGPVQSSLSGLSAPVSSTRARAKNGTINYSAAENDLVCTMKEVSKAAWSEIAKACNSQFGTSRTKGGIQVRYCRVLQHRNGPKPAPTPGRNGRKKATKAATTQKGSSKVSARPKGIQKKKAARAPAAAAERATPHPDWFVAAALLRLAGVEGY